MTKNVKVTLVQRVIGGMDFPDQEIAARLGLRSAAQINLLRIGAIKFPITNCRQLSELAKMPYSAVVEAIVRESIPDLWMQLVASGLVLSSNIT